MQQGLIDTRFKKAIDEQMTVQEAINKGLLDPKKGFGMTIRVTKSPMATATAPFFISCTTIVPVGWDLAARLIHDNLKAVDGPKSLGDLTQLAPFCGETGFEKDTTAVCTTDVICALNRCRTDAEVCD